MCLWRAETPLHWFHLPATRGSSRAQLLHSAVKPSVNHDVASGAIGRCLFLFPLFALFALGGFFFFLPLNSRGLAKPSAHLVGV